MQTITDLTDDLLALLAPITRDRYDYTGTAQTKTTVNATGIDLHVGDIRNVAQAPDGTAAPYMVLYPQAGVDRHTRLSRGATITTWGFQLTVAAGSLNGAQWALTKVRGALTRARLNNGTGILTSYFDQIEIIPDRDATPPRWYAPLRYTASVH